jgi:hypothetical protein
VGRETYRDSSNETNILGFNYTSISIFRNARHVSGKLMDIFTLIGQVGAPIAAGLVMGAFIFVIMKQIMGGVVNQIATLKGFCEMLVTRIKTMNNDIIRLDTSVASALDLTPDLDRIARAENFVEDGKLDVRRD